MLFLCFQIVELVIFRPIVLDSAIVLMENHVKGKLESVRILSVI